MEESAPAKLLAAALTKVRQSGWRLVARNSVEDKSPQWFVDTPALPAGEFIRGPFPSREQAAQAADQLTAAAVVTGLAEAGYVIVPRSLLVDDRYAAPGQLTE